MTTYLKATAAVLAMFAGAAHGQVLIGEALAQPIPEAPQPRFDMFFAAPDLPAPANVPAEYLNIRGVRLNVEAIAKAQVGRRFAISPEGGDPESWTVESVAEPSADVRIVRLRLETDPTGYAVFVTCQDATAMTLHVASRLTTYRLQFAGNGNYHVWRVNREMLEPEAMSVGSFPEPPRELDPTDDDWQPTGIPMPADAGACGGTSRVLDIMMPYTAEARDAIGGTTAMRAECALAVDHANTAYQNSAMSTRMRLVYCNLITYTESGDQGTDLTRLRVNGDGFMDDVHTTRDSVNADIVELVTNTGSGIGRCPSGAPTYGDSPFSTGKWTRIAATYTCAHETGHNLGGGHNVADGGACGPSYGVGWLFFGTDGNGYCTVLAYPDATHDRVLHFSNPNVSYQGTPTGVAIGLPNEAFNARVLTDNDNTIEGFEFTRYDIYVNFAFPGIPIENGTAAFPYNTMTEAHANIDTPNTGAGENPTMYITAGSTNWTGTLTKAMAVIPCGGTVTIGN